MEKTTAKTLVRIGSSLFILALSILFVLILGFFPWFAQLERSTYDFVFRVRPDIAPPSNVVIVSIDESSQTELGPLPWSRKTHAALLRKLKAEGARVAVFDVLFDQPKSTEEDQDFADAIAEFGNVVLGQDLSRTSDPQFAMEQTIEPLPIFLEAGASPGFVFTPADPDTKIRRACWLVNDQPTLASQAIFKYTGERVVQRDDRIFLGKDEAPVESAGQYPDFVINFVGPAHTIPTRSYYQVLDGTIPKGFLKDKVVFVGADLAAENKTGGPSVDRFPTPVDTDVLMPGVEIHANAFNTILNRSFIRTARPNVIWLVLLTIAILATLYSTLLRPLPAGLTTLGTAAVATSSVYYIFVNYNYWLPSVRPSFLIAFIYGGNTLMQFRSALRERAQIQKAFKHYVSAEVLGELMKNPENLGLGGREAEATVLFTDIAGFSKISEKIPPQELTELLNQYFELLAGVIMKEGGMVNKFIGDAVMAIWGVPLDNPRHAVQACRASLEIHRALIALEPVKCRVGLNSGVMIAGNMGSRERFEYTVIGDAVNLASRLEGVNKLYHTDIMISEFTEAKVHGEFLLREVDSIRVVGRDEPVRIFQLLDKRENKGTPEHDLWSQMIESYLPGLEAYRKREWKTAVALFEKHDRFFAEDPVGKIYLQRCREFAINPPSGDWDGIYQMETK